MKQRTILLVDNSREFRETRSEWLTKHGFKVVAAATPEEALRLAALQRFDVALLDVRLIDDNDTLDYSGLKLAAQLPPYLHKLIVTGYDVIRARGEAIKFFPEGIPYPVKFIPKAAGPDGVIAAIDEVINLLCIAEAGFVHRVQASPKNTKVFVVHGHDHGAKEAVARFLERRGFECVILIEMAGGGMTIIEQLEQNSDVGVVIAILTPDDFGYGQKETHENRRARARQNVIFELGYFVGKLGRPYVRMLYKPDVEILSDVHGVKYIEMDDAHAWEHLLMAELEKCGYRFNKRGKIIKH